MVNSISLFLADVFIRKLTDNFIFENPFFAVRCVDDALAFIDQKQGHAEYFLDNLIKNHSHIKFTLEIEKKTMKYIFRSNHLKNDFNQLPSKIVRKPPDHVMTENYNHPFERKCQLSIVLRKGNLTSPSRC